MNKSQMPRVSILMGVYNCANTLGEAIDSILCQTYSDWELIICDDGSADDTLQIVREYAARDPRIVIAQNFRNLGLNHTLNHCLKLARGELCARMDGDDVSEPERLEKLVLALDSNPKFALVSSWVSFFDEGGKWGVGRSKPQPDSMDLATGTPFCHAACMIRTGVLRDLGGYGTDAWLRRSQDYHLWFRLYAAGHRGVNLQEVLYRVRDGRDAVGRRGFSVRLMEARIMWFGFRLLKFPLWQYFRILRPLVLGLIPGWLYAHLHKRKRRSAIHSEQGVE
jgi:glycosyltransferase EpsE